jgi:predicted MFS family arabinose efflux permease
VALAVAGAATVATSFGMARYGYGLLLPDIQAGLAHGAATLGLIGSLAYVAYVAAGAAVTTLSATVGERATVVAGGALAVAGTVTVAASASATELGIGVALAGASAGLVYPPFANAVAGLPDGVRRRVLATINCGTGWGVAVAAPIAIAAGDAWRVTYVGFAACAVLSTVIAAHTLPPLATRPPAPAPHHAAVPLGRRVAPLITATVLVGLGSAAFWTYAVDQLHAAGLGGSASKAMLGVAGVTSILAVGAADVTRAFGARRTFVLSAALEAAAIATIALAPGHLAAALGAGAAFGTAYNTNVAVTVLWSTDLSPDRPTAGLAVATTSNALGLLGGPFLGGLLAAATSLTVTMLAGAAVTLTALAVTPWVGRRPQAAAGAGAAPAAVTVS